MVLQISNEGDDRLGAKIKTPQKSLGLPKKSLDQILTPKKSYAKFPRPSLVALYSENYAATNFQIGLNTPKLPT